MDVRVRFGRGAGGGSGHVAAGSNNSSDPAGVAGGGRGTVDPAARALRGGFARAASACCVNLTSNGSSSGPEATAAVPTKFAWVHDAATLEVWSRRPGRDGAPLLRIDVVDLQGTDAGEVDSWAETPPQPYRKLTVAGFPPKARLPACPQARLAAATDVAVGDATYLAILVAAYVSAACVTAHGPYAVKYMLSVLWYMRCPPAGRPRRR